MARIDVRMNFEFRISYTRIWKVKKEKQNEFSAFVWEVFGSIPTRTSKQSFNIFHSTGIPTSVHSQQHTKPFHTYNSMYKMYTVHSE